MEHLLDPYSLLIEPLTAYAFMRRALVACLALALGSGPIGVFLVLRRMSLMGDAMSHAVLPGAAIGFIFAGLSLGAMSLGGLIAGLAVALLAGVVSRTTVLREDASLAGFYLASLALGVLLVSTYGSAVDLLHVLFGSILAVDDEGLLFVAAVASITLITLALIYRPLVAECFDPTFLRSVGARGSLIHLLFLVLVVLNLVAGFQALGTLMAVGLMMLPAAAARFWSDSVWGSIAFATGAAMASGVVGLLLSYHFELPSGPAIVLTAAVVYLASIVFGSRAGLLVRYRRQPHFHKPEEMKP
ncbi:MAG: metal ABC transporter permease [Alphaproteobacteria bacterium]|nr:metal ABC transporter permease [Alphaproteobacteria bacterium]